MQPIQDLLNRIRWDKDFARAEFKLGYYDRLLDKVLVVPMAQVYLDGETPFFVEVQDEEGEWHRVPLHRIKRVFRNGELIWQRRH